MSLILWTMIGIAAVANVLTGIYLALDYNNSDELPRETAEEARVAIIVADYLRAMNEERYEEMGLVWANVDGVPGLEAALPELHAELTEGVA